MPCEQFLQQIENSRPFPQLVSHGEKSGKFQFVVEIAHKAVILIFICLYQMIRLILSLLCSRIIFNSQYKSKIHKVGFIHNAVVPPYSQDS